MGSDIFLVLEIQVLIHLTLVQRSKGVLVTCLLVYGLSSNLLLRLIW